MRIYVMLELINGPGDLRVRVVAVDEGLVEADAQFILHMALVDVGQDAHHRLQQEDQQQRENVLQQMTTPIFKYITGYCNTSHNIIRNSLYLGFIKNNHWSNFSS